MKPKKRISYLGYSPANYRLQFALAQSWCLLSGFRSE